MIIKHYTLILMLSVAPLMAQAVDFGANRPVTLVDQPVVTSPTYMQTTSPLFSQRRATVPMVVSEPFGGFGRHASVNSSFSVISFTTSGYTKGGKSRRTWFSDGFLQTDGLMRSGSTYASNTTRDLNGGGAPSGPRRVGGDEHDPDPFMGEPVPVGDLPIYLLGLLTAVYAFIRRRRMAL